MCDNEIICDNKICYYWWKWWAHCRKNGNKDLILASTDKNKKVLGKYTGHWDGIKILN